MKYRVIGVLSAVLLAGGAVMSQGGAPSSYEVPSDLAFLDPHFGCSTGISDDVANYVAWAVPEKRVVVGLQERNPGTGEWEREQYVYSTSYEVLDVAFRLGGQELYVSGVQIDGTAYSDVIEKWVFPVASGGYSVTISGGTTTIGVPRGSLAASVALNGGSYVQPGGRSSTRQPVPTKTMLVQVPNGGHFNCLVADPEGRFLLLHNYTTGDVLSLDLASPTAPPQIVYSKVQVPSLQAARTMVLHDVEEIGRICRLTAEDRYGAYPLGTNETTILVDTQNDGVFDSFTVHTSVDLARGLTPYGDSAEWRSVVNFGWDWEADYK